MILHKVMKDRVRPEFENSYGADTYPKGVTVMLNIIIIIPKTSTLHLTSALSLKAGYSVLFVVQITLKGIKTELKIRTMFH